MQKENERTPKDTELQQQSHDWDMTELDFQDADTSGRGLFIQFLIFTTPELIPPQNKLLNVACVWTKPRTNFQQHPLMEYHPHI